MDPIFPFLNKIRYFKVRRDRARNEKYDSDFLAYCHFVYAYQLFSTQLNCTNATTNMRHLQIFLNKNAYDMHNLSFCGHISTRKYFDGKISGFLHFLNYTGLTMRLKAVGKQ